MRYEFDEDFQIKVAALALRDPDFNARTEGLIEPGYFVNETVARLVDLHLRHWEKYKSCPSVVTLTKLIKDAIAAKVIRASDAPEIVETVKTLMKADISDRDYVVDEVASFARHQAIIKAMTDSVDHLEKRDFDAIEKKMSEALQIGALEEGERTSVWADIDARTLQRKAVASGSVKTGITTGIKKLDEALDHAGWGRRELASLMGAAKSGKSFALMNFAVEACRAGHPTLHISLENSLGVTTKRIDAYVSKIETNKMGIHIHHVDAAVKAFAATAAPYHLHQFPASTFRPKDLRRLMERYRAKGVLFDFVVVDYADIMAPDVRTRDNPIQDSKNVYQGLREIAQIENVAMLTATQTNREGAKATVATAVHVAEDYNRVRICDLVISINRDDDDRANGTARLFFAAGRNQEDGYTMTIKQNLSTATFCERVLAAGV